MQVHDILALKNMKFTLPAQKISAFVRRAVAVLSVGMLAIPMAQVARAQDAEPTPAVLYTPELTQVQGLLPVTRTFSVSVTAPSNLSTGVTIPITLVATPNGIPASVSAATALSYLSFNAAGTGLPITALSFNAPNQVVSFNITLAVPADAIPGSYGYKISTVGWTIIPGIGLTNVGTFIQATVTAAAAFTPPDVTISAPVDSSIVTVASTAFPVSLPFQFQSTSTGTESSPISEVTADLDGVQLVLSSTGLNTTTVNSGATLVIAAPGVHTVIATAKNLGGSSSDVNSFTIVVTAPPPTVVINSPTPNSVYTYRVGSAATVVPFSFTANSSLGGIRTLTAKVDNANVVFTATGLGTLQASGLINLPYTTAGTHTVSVTTTDDNGTATATSNFSINVVAPTPTIAISQPTAGAVFTAASGASTVNVPYTFTTTSNNGFFVDSVSASLDGNPITIGSTTGLGTATAVSTGTLANVTAGSHTLVVTGISAGITVSTSTSFTVNATQLPPTVVINTPPVGSTFTRVTGGAALSIPLSFTGTSTPTTGVITQLKATLNGTALAVSSTTLGQRIATGTATMTVSNAGTYTISVTAVDAYGTASATRTFSVVVVQPRNVYGSVFFDTDADGVFDCEDFDLSGITVRLLNSTGQVIATDVTDCGGDYSFCGLAPGTYVVDSDGYAGLKPSTLSERTITITTADVCVPRMGYTLDFVAIRSMTATGFTIGYWKNNIDKAIKGSTSGIQVSKTTLTNYTNKISCFALSTYDCMSFKTASSIMGYSGSTPSLLLSKQLIASEYNYQNGAYLNGNRSLTMLFLWWGEYVVANPSKYSSTYQIWAKDWFDAYNNSHGGLVVGPLP
jgi:PKD repeat protein